MVKIHVRASAVLALELLCACGPDGGARRDSAGADLLPRASDSASAVHAALVGELRREVERWVQAPPAEMDSGRVQFTSEPSAVLPGLVYHWATYAPPRSSHLSFRVVMGERAGRRE